MESSVAEWVECIYSPTSSVDSRRLGHNALEAFKDGQSNVAEVGWRLAASRERPLYVRHCGLQLVEHTIKYRWTDLAAQQRQDVRQNWFEFVAQKLDSIQNESSHMKESLARCLAEMVKQEWPQNWPDLIEQLGNCVQGDPCRAQIVYLSLLRLVEDVVLFQTVQPTARRRDLHNALVVSLDALLNGCLDTLVLCSAHQSDQVILAKTVLEFLSQLMDWIPAKQLEPVLDKLLPMLCAFLNSQNDTLRVQSATCLWQLSARKRSKAEELRPVLALFSESTMTAILTAAKRAASQCSSEHYAFLRCLCSLLSSVGQHLSALWKPDDSDFEQMIQSFPLYLSAILAFYQHPSVYLRHEAAQVILSFACHKQISRSPVFTAVLPSILTDIPRIIQKFGLPSRNDSETCAYSNMDYDSDNMFLLEYTQLRERSLRIVRESVSIDWRTPYGVCLDWLRNRVVAQCQQITEQEMDAMNRYLKAVFDTLPIKENNLAIQLVECLDALLQTLSGLTDFEVIDRLLSTMSALFVCLPAYPDRVPAVLEQISRVLLINDGDSLSLKALKRHALSDVLRLSTDFSSVAVPYGEQVFGMAQSVLPALSLMQQSQLLQSLAAISNHFPQQQQQIDFLQIALGSSKTYLLSPAVSGIVVNVETFLKFLGLLNAELEADSSALQQVIHARKELRAHCSMVEGVLSQIQCTPERRDAIFQLFVPILPTIYRLARCLNGIYSSAAIAKVKKVRSSAIEMLDMPDVEKLQICSSSDMQQRSAEGCFQNKSEASHLKAFINDFTESIQIITGCIPVRFSSAFYTDPSASEYLLDGCVGFISDCMDLRLRYWLRRTWKPILSNVSNGPISHIQVVLPAIQRLFVHMQQRLDAKWTEIMKRLETADEDPNAEQTNQEIFLQDVTCLLTREYVLLLNKILMSHTDEPGESSSERRTAPKLSVLGQYLLDDMSVMPSLCLTLFSCLSWRDGVSCVKSMPLCELVVAHLTATGKMDSAAANHLMLTALRSLANYSEQDEQLGLLLTLNCKLYQIMRQSVPELRNLLLQIPDCGEEAVNNLEEKLFNSSKERQFPEKVKRDCFKRVVRGILGKTVSLKFARPAQMRPLPALLKPQKQNENDKNYNENLGICALFGNHD